MSKEGKKKAKNEMEGNTRDGKREKKEGKKRGWSEQVRLVFFFWLTNPAKNLQPLDWFKEWEKERERK